MKSWLLAALVGVLVFAGCGIRDRTEGLQQEKLLLDLMKTQSDQLAQLMQKENDLRGLAKKNQESLAEVERQRTALQTLQQEAAREDRAAKDALAQEKTKLQTARDGLEAEKRRVQAAEQKNQASEREIAAQREELSRLRASMRPEPRVEIPATDVRRREQEQKSHAEIAARVKKRQPYLDELATLTANFFASGMVRAPVRNEVLDLLAQSNIAQSKEDDAFVDGALGIAEAFYLNRTKYPYLTHEQKAFDQWKKAYLAAAVAPADKPTISHSHAFVDFESGSARTTSTISPTEMGR